MMLEMIVEKVFSCIASSSPWLALAQLNVVCAEVFWVRVWVTTESASRPVFRMLHGP